MIIIIVCRDKVKMTEKKYQDTWIFFFMIWNATFGKASLKL